MEHYHVPVMLEEALEALSVKRGGVYVDATLGGCGHSLAILGRLSELGGGSLFAIDRDAEAIAHARAVLEGDAAVSEALRRGVVSMEIIKGNFADMAGLSERLKETGADGVLMDLGVSSHQLDTPERGFSFRSDAELDMRMDPDGDGPSAAELIAQASERELFEIIRDYGEERFARRIASAICEAARTAPIRTTARLAEIVSGAVPKYHPPRGGKAIHPATRTFQALRIACNRELEALRSGLQTAFELLRPQGRLAVISYHSLEDRIVKRFCKEKLGRCTCSPDMPICVCGAEASLRELTRKPLLPSAGEVADNPRARSAKLRVCEKLHK